MKKIFLFTLISLLFTALTSCSDAELEELPYLDQVDEGFTSVWTDQGPSYTLVLKPVNDIQIQAVIFHAQLELKQTHGGQDWLIRYTPALNQDNIYTFNDFERDFSVSQTYVFHCYAEIQTNVGTYVTKIIDTTAQ